MNAEPADDDLSLVMAELTAGLGARAGAILFDAGDGRVRVLHACDPEAAIDRLVRAATAAIDTFADGPQWVQGDDHGFEAMLLARIRGDGGPGQWAIAMTFAGLGPGERHGAERALARVAPLAGAYLRLWLAGRAQAAAVRSAHAALDRSGLGTILLDAGGEMTFANEAACALLDAGDGLRRVRSRVAARDLGDTVRLQLAIEQAVATGGAADGRDAPLLAIGRTGRPALVLAVLPVERGEEPGAAAILYVMDPARDVGELLRPVCRAYRLSPAEALLARHLVAGDTVAAAAARMSVKPMTARGYLKQIFLKTDTHRQPELVQLMLSSIIHTHPPAARRAGTG